MWARLRLPRQHIDTVEPLATHSLSERPSDSEEIEDWIAPGPPAASQQLRRRTGIGPAIKASTARLSHHN